MSAEERSDEIIARYRALLGPIVPPSMTDDELLQAVEGLVEAAERSGASPEDLARTLGDFTAYFQELYPSGWPHVPEPGA